MKTTPAPIPVEAVALLGAVSDYSIAKRFGLKRSRIIALRHKLKIKPTHPPGKPFEWTPARLARLGEDTDIAVAAELGISKAVAKKKRRLGG